MVASTPIYVPISIKDDGTVIYNNRVNCANAYDMESRTFTLRLKPKIENPKIDGIILFKGKLDGKIKKF